MLRDEPAAPLWLVSVAFAVATAALTWPQLVHLSSVAAHPDSWFGMWRLAWIAHQLPRDPLHLFDANIHYPEPATLAYSDATLVEGLIGAPLLWAGVPVPIAYNILLLGSFVFAGVSAYALVRSLTGSNRAGAVAGVIFAFAPYRFDHYMHLELLWSGWMPLALLALHRAFDTGRVRWGVAAGALTALQLLSCIYYGVFFVLVLPVLVVCLSVGKPRERLLGAWRGLAVGAVVLAAAAAIYAPAYLTARRSVGERGVAEVRMYSAGPTHYLSATPENVVYGGWTARLGRPEKRLFPGVCALLLLVAAIWPPLSAPRAAYLAALLFAIDLSFGTNGLTFGWLRDHVLPLRGLRVPARAGQLALLMTGVLAGFGVARIERRLGTSGHARLQRASIAIVPLMLVEFLAPPRALAAAPTSPSLLHTWLTDHPGVVAELPMPEEHHLPLHDAEFEYASTFHWNPLLNGHTGNVPRSYVELLRSMATFPSDEALRCLRSRHVDHIVVHEEPGASARYEQVVAALASHGDLPAHGPFTRDGSRSMVFDLGRDGAGR